MPAPRLSFCIPTYNFAAFLPETLDSIIEQATDEVEIVIVDGASTDETPDIIEDYRRRFDRIVYHRRDQRMGVAADILRSVELASGDYCWLFSADDVLRPGSIEAVLPRLTGEWNAMIAGITICDGDMNPVEPHPVVNGIDEPTVFDLDEPGQRRDYFDRAHTSTALFSFISSVVVRRADWLDASIATDLLDDCWIIAAKACAMMSRGMRVCYWPGPLVDKRGDNDSFLARGVAWRIRLAVEGFPAIGARFFDLSSHEYATFRRVVRNELSVPAMAMFTLKAYEQEGRDGLTELRRLARLLWLDSGWANRARYFALRATPIPVLRMVRAIVSKRCSHNTDPSGSDPS